MEIIVRQAPDTVDPFVQGIDIAAKETINGQEFGIAVKLTDLSFRNENLLDILGDVAIQIENGFRRHPVASIAANRVRPAFAAYFDRLLIQRLEQPMSAETREESMVQMQPKDILVHLEKGDRTDEFVEPKLAEGLIMDGFMATPLNQMYPMARQATNQELAQMQQRANVGFASAGMLSGQIGGPFRW